MYEGKLERRNPRQTKLQRCGGEGNFCDCFVPFFPSLPSVIKDSRLKILRIFLEPRRRHQVKARQCAQVSREPRMLAGHSRNHDGTTMKKQIDPPIKAHFLRALILLSLLIFSQEIFCQTPTPTATATP